VTGVQSSSWQRLTGQWGSSARRHHPNRTRHDAGLIAAEVIVELRRMCDSGTYGALRATVGKITFGPGQTNIIPATATLTIDLRNPVDQQMSAADEHLADVVRDLTARHGVQTTLDRIAKTAVVPFDEQVQGSSPEPPTTSDWTTHRPCPVPDATPRKSPRSAPPP
jgi:beta-ureidopropionase / N-carbamoyl-L-amino-acid hydrolase